MEKRIRTNLGANYDHNLLSSSIVNCIASEYLIDLTRETIRKYHKEIDLSDISDEFAECIDESYNVSFSNMSDWLKNKSNKFTKMLELIVRLDEFLVSHEKIEKNQVVADIQQKLNFFVVKLTNVRIEDEFIDFTEIDIEEEYIKKTFEQLNLVNEAQVLCQLASSELEFSPLDVERFRNTFIEEKLNKINSIRTSCENTLNKDLDKLNNQIIQMYDKVYDTSYATLTDGEKVDKLRKYIKFVNSHKQLLDKLEDKLTQANELKRQLIVHKKRLDESLKVENETLKKKIKEDPTQEDLFTSQIDGVNFVTHNYFLQIDTAIENVNKLEEKINKQYKVIEQLELAFKNSLPSDKEMNKYSSIGFKFQELQVRLELSKSQIGKEQQGLKKVIDTINVGLSALIAHSLDFKDLFLRNNMVGATFKAVDAIYDFVSSTNKLTAMSQLKFLTDKLDKYNDLVQNFTNDILLYRKVSNDAIRDIAIIMSKPMQSDNLKQIIEIIDLTNSQFEQLYKTLDDNNKQQIEVVHAIMEI